MSVCRIDPEAHEGDSPRAVELAAFNGRVETFARMAEILEIDPNTVWFQLAQVLGLFLIKIC